MIDALRGLYEALLASETLPVRVDLKCLAEDTQHVGIRVQRAVDDGHDETLGVVLDERLFDDALACAWVSDDDAEAALLAVHAQCVLPRRRNTRHLLRLAGGIECVAGRGRSGRWASCGGLSARVRGSRPRPNA